MKISVLSYFPFPDGLAATTRIRAYLKGLKELGVDSEAIVYNPTSKYTPNKDIPSIGYSEEGIKYCYPNGRYFSKHKIYRLISIYINSWVKTTYYIYRSNKKKKIDFLFIANDKLPILFYYIMICKILKINSIFITDEYPGAIRSKLKKNISKIQKWAYNFILKYTKGEIFMTEALCKYYNPQNKIPNHILPTITDFSRFDVKNNMDTNNDNYICYLGNMELSKDNVDNIIVAFSKIAERFPDINFYLYGAPSERDKNKLSSLIRSLKLEKRVFLKGKVDFNKVPEILSNAKILVSSQPNTKRAEGGFPTKLGEYLATGKPVLLTDVGEISQCVIKNKHLYIVPPENPELYAEKLAYILENYEEAIKVGQAGKEYVKANYGYQKISQNLLFFLNGIK